jgi:hypothetical protein
MRETKRTRIPTSPIAYASPVTFRLGLTIFTFRACSFMENELNMLTALSASLCALIVMKAKPLDLPLLRSLINSTEMTSPAFVNKVERSSSVAEPGRFPTYNSQFIFGITFAGKTG